MKIKSYIWLLLIPALLFLSQCREVEDCMVADSSTDLLEVPPGFPPIPFPEDNAYTPERWELGRRLFYDPLLSKDASLSCASCHKIQLAFSDDQALSPGVAQRPGVRNAAPLVNLAYHPYYLREGSLPSLEMQVLVPIQEENEMAHNMVLIGEQLAEISDYVVMSQAAYQRDPDPYVITRALATFERTLISGRSPYDQWQHQGCESALSPAQKRGAELFFSAETGCSHCHGGFNFTNYSFENNGLYLEYADPGRMRFTEDPADRARFKVPTLRNIGLTAPYMHDGSMADLWQVVEHYNQGGKGHVNQHPLVRPLGLSENEVEDLVAFLESLTDPGFVGNPAFGPP